MGLVDHHGRWVIEPQFDQMELLSESLYLVGVGSQWGVIRVDWNNGPMPSGI